HAHEQHPLSGSTAPGPGGRRNGCETGFRTLTHMLRIGLTGGIGCGKSTVAVMMGELGCHIINADKMAHALIAPGEPAYDEVIREFGKDIAGPDPAVERPRLA